ncbi:helix-turn-helix domain-containing protein [Chryseobacterium salivictor]|uniref:HTH-type transcriptional activator RhaS n=1 Tax=Chryseobacterium salivictor TaxID=2547600 RepID=A0A4P6ZIT4_9FLAO|nr:helix-turn-helix domain-containing protein [Chryseobacterium salivictor]QBO59522.1 HTH-type transcriptional activator RhaS [Chryseobacterium salivictor]
MAKRILLSLFLFAITLLKSQDIYSEFRKKYWEYEENDEKAFVYLNLSISSAKKEKNYAELSQAYKDAVRFSQNNKLQYADSTIIAAKLSKSNSLIGNAYTGKGIVYYFNYRKFQPALNEYLKADEYLENADDPFLRYQNLYHIGVVKSYLGYHKESLEIFKECIAYFESNTKANIHPNLIKNNRKGYLNSLHQTIICYQHLGNYKEAEKLIDEGFKRIPKEAFFDLERSYFYKSKGITEFKDKSYQKAINNFESAIPELLKINDFTWSSVVYFYRGMSYAKLGNTEKALTDYKRVDSIFNKHHFILPEIRKNYEELIDYYKDNKNAKNELFYTKQLLKADSIIANDFKYLSTRIHKDYDTKTLLKSRNNLEKTSSVRKYLLIASSLIIILLGGVVLYWFRRKKDLQNKYDKLLLKMKNTDSEKENESLEEVFAKNSKLDVKLIQNLKKGFSEFEKSKGFLEKSITAGKLATQLDTNATYLSLFVKEFKGNNFNTYINKLRVEYAIDKIYNEKDWRKYSVEDIASACGFSNRQNFSNFFFEQYGIRPTDFLKQRKKELEDGNISSVISSLES